MNWKNIKVSRDWTHFLFEGQPLFQKAFKSVLKFHAPGLAPVEGDDGWFFIDSDGETRIPGPFKKAWGFYCGLSAVEDDSGCYHINPYGLSTYTNRFEWVGNFQEDLCSVRAKDGAYFHIRKNGERIYPIDYRYAGDYKDGLACIMLQNGRFKHIDDRGAYIYDSEFLDLGVFHKGLATARDEDGWFHINLQGKAIYPERYQSLEPFYNGQAFADSFGKGKILRGNRSETCL